MKLFAFLPRLTLLLIAAGWPPVTTADQAAIDYKISPHVIYGQGNIVREGSKVARDLWMDVYQPSIATATPRTAIIMTFGGSFHRGGPRHTFLEGGAQDTSMGDYCRRFALAGHVCFAIDYRLAPEAPIPSRSDYTDEDLNLAPIAQGLSRINIIRGKMGLEPIRPDNTSMLDNAVLAAAEDLRLAVEYVRGSAAHYNIATDRLVLGGFSAGAITSLNVAHGMGVPVAGVFMLSGASAGFDISKSVTRSSNSPPVLMFVGQNDLGAIQASAPLLLGFYEKVGVQHSLAWVPGFGHFYPAGATSLSGDGRKMSIEERILTFLADIDSGP